jgi:exodeoxyribonuclease VII small subunit
MKSSKLKNTVIDKKFDSIPESFEEAVAELEALVNTMDDQNMGLERLLIDYKRGAFLVKYCRERLGQVRKEVTEIEQNLNKVNPEEDQ